MTQPSLFGDTLTKNAELSICGVYRYQLSRMWDADKPPLGWIMLNPSTADASVDDPTIRRCVSFARSWGYGGILVGNLFALRAPDPTALSTASDPEGPENELHIRRIGRTCSTVICAWGAHPMAEWLAGHVVHLLQAQGARVCCLGTTKAGHPRHPLYVKGDTAPEVYPAVVS